MMSSSATLESPLLKVRSTASATDFTRVFLGALECCSGRCIAKSDSSRSCRSPGETSTLNFAVAVLGLRFGGAFTESSAYLLNQLSKENRDKIITAYFSKDGANYSLQRTHMNSCDFSLNQYSYAPVVDDMTLEHVERKRLQVLHAKALSKEARMIRIADKACNMQDLMAYPMINWSLEKKRAYVQNSVLVVDQIRGANLGLEDWFDETVKKIKAMKDYEGL